MKELGNLAVVCAKRHNTLMQVHNSTVTVHVGNGPRRKSIALDWHDDVKIRALIWDLNHGRLREKIMKGDGAA